MSIVRLDWWHTRRLTLALVLVAGAALVPAAPGGATLTGSTFNASDGNLIVDGSDTKDWANIGINCTATTKVGCGIDLPTGQNDDSFGGGADNKEDGNPPPVTFGSIPNNKSDLQRFYVASSKENGDDFLYLAWERVQDPNGTTNMDFEFNKSRTKSSNDVTPVRSPGDVLVKYDLSQGGFNPTLGYHFWLTELPSGAANAAAVCEASNSLPCWDKVHSLAGYFEGRTNSGEVVDPINPDAPRTLSPRTFGEAAINLTDSGIFRGCSSLGSAFLKSRSSDSFTASMKDYIAPINVTITNCGTVNIHKVDDAGNVLGGVVFTLYTDNTSVGGTRQSNDTVTTHTCTTDATTGDCSIANVPFGNYWLVETTPSGYQQVADTAFTLSSSSQTFSTTITNNRDRSWITIVKNDDDSPANPVNGASFTAYVDVSPFGGTKGTGDTTVAGSCGPTAAGTCTISNLLLGHYWVVETTTPNGYTTAANQATELTVANAGTGVTLTFVDKREFKVIVIVCQEGTTPSLYSTPVTVDSVSAGNSISAAPSGATVAAICGVTDGAKGDLHYGNHAATANIAQ